MLCCVVGIICVSCPFITERDDVTVDSLNDVRPLDEYNRYDAVRYGYFFVAKYEPATQYHIQVAAGDDADFTAVLYDRDDFTGNEIWVADLQLASGQYRWRVRARDESGWGNWSASVSAAFTSCLEYMNFSDSDETTSVAPEFDWNDVEGAAGYEIQLFDGEERWTVETVESSYRVPSQRSFSYGDVLAYRIRPVFQEGGKSLKGFWCSEKELGIVPEVVLSNSTDAVLRWEGSSDTATYDLRISDEMDMSNILLAANDLGVSEYDISSLAEGYFFVQIRITDQGKTGEWSEVIPCSKAVGITVINATESAEIAILYKSGTLSSTRLVAYSLVPMERYQWWVNGVKSDATDAIIELSDLTGDTYAVTVIGERNGLFYSDEQILRRTEDIELSVESGKYYEAQHVSLQCQGADKIYYAFEPLNDTLSNAVEYTSPFTLDTSGTIYATAVTFGRLYARKQSADLEIVDAVVDLRLQGTTSTTAEFEVAIDDGITPESVTWYLDDAVQEGGDTAKTFVNLTGDRYMVAVAVAPDDSASRIVRTLELSRAAPVTVSNDDPATNQTRNIILQSEGDAVMYYTYQSLPAVPDEEHTFGENYDCVAYTSPLSFNYANNDGKYLIAYAAEAGKLYSRTFCEEIFFGDMTVYNPTGDKDGDTRQNRFDDDIDGDGLTNEFERNTSFTDIYESDSDGDSWSDSEEVRMFNNTNGIEFSPVIADIPRVDMELATESSVEFFYQIENEEEVSSTLTYTNGSEYSHTDDQGLSRTVGHEQSYSESLGFEFGMDGAEWNWNFSIGQEATFTNSTESSCSLSSSDTYTNTMEASEAESVTTGKTLTSSGGAIGVGVRFVNSGCISYTLRDLQLTAYQVDPANEQLVSTITTLEQGSAHTDSTVILGPGDSSDIIEFSDTTLPFEKALEVFRDTREIRFSISSCSVEIGDKEITDALTNVAALTSEIIIDYGPGKEKSVEMYNVAAKTRINPDFTSINDLYNPIPLDDMLKTIQVSYALGTYNTHAGIDTINGVSNDAANNAYWIIAHTHGDATEYYSILDATYDLGSIEVVAQDTVEFIYSTDADRDGVPLRIEKIFGSDDTTRFSDEDGWDDLREIQEGTLPGCRDTDGDGEDDDVDDDPLYAEPSSNTLLTDIVVAKGDQSYHMADLIGRNKPLYYDDFNITVYSEDGIHSAELQNTTLGSAPVSLSHGSARNIALPVQIGTANDFTLTITAEDMTTSDEYHFTLTPTVPSLAEISGSNISSIENSVSWSYPEDGQLYTGMILIRRGCSTCSTFPGIPATVSSITEDQNLGDTSYRILSDWSSINRAVTQYADTGLSPGVRYLYSGLLYYKEPGESTYYLGGERHTAPLSTPPLANAKFIINPYALVVIDDTEAGYSEYQWDIECAGEDSSGNSLDGTAFMLSSIRDRAGDVNVEPGKVYYYESGVSKVEMNTGDYTLFDLVGSPQQASIWVDDFDDTGAYSSDPYQNLLNEAAADTEDDLYFSPGDAYRSFSFQQKEGNAVVLYVSVNELDPGPEYNPIADTSYRFVYRDNGTVVDYSDDYFELSTATRVGVGSVNSTKPHIDSDDTVIYSSDGARTWFSPVFNPFEYPHDVVEAFFQLQWISEFADYN